MSIQTDMKHIAPDVMSSSCVAQLLLTATLTVSVSPYCHQIKLSCDCLLFHSAHSNTYRIDNPIPTSQSNCNFGLVTVNTNDNQTNQSSHNDEHNCKIIEMQKASRLWPVVEWAVRGKWTSTVQQQQHYNISSVEDWPSWGRVCTNYLWTQTNAVHVTTRCVVNTKRHWTANHHRQQCNARCCYTHTNELFMVAVNGAAKFEFWRIFINWDEYDQMQNIYHTEAKNALMHFSANRLNPVSTSFNCLF